MVSEVEKRRRERIKKNNARYWLGKKRSLEDRQKMSLAKIGRYNGENNPFFGKKHTHETIEKLKILLKGRRAAHPFPKGHIPWNKGIKSHNSGENHYNWQGGLTPKNTKIRNSIEYKLWRKSVFERDNYTCQNCGVKGVYFHADHIKSFALHPELRFQLSNGRTLCVPCHKKTPSYLVNPKK